jgi:hypothetical protein
VAFALSVIVPVDVVPPTTEVGLRTTEAIPGVAVIERVALADWPFAEAAIVEVSGTSVSWVVTVKVPVVEPAATVTVAGTVAFVPVAVRLTVRPPVGAGPLIVTVPVEVRPPMTAVGLRATAVTTGGLTVSVAETALDPEEMTGDAAAATGSVVTAKVAVFPLDTVTVAGTVAAEVLLERSGKLIPAAGTGPVRVMVPVNDVPPVTAVGFRVIEVAVGA